MASVQKVVELGRGAFRDGVRRLASSTTGTTRVWALTVVVAAIALVLATIEQPAGRLAQAPVVVPWWFLAGPFLSRVTNDLCFEWRMTACTAA